MIGHCSVHLQEESDLARDRGLRLVTIDILPDDALMEIFNFCGNTDNPLWYIGLNTWYTLVHVCRRWRYLVFASPRRLNIRLEYRGNRPMSEVLDIWPVLPVSVIREFDHRWDNIVAALESEHSDRICEIYIPYMTNSHWEGFASAMQKPFPELTHLRVSMADVVRVLPDSFLGGSAPRLRTLWLERIPCPSLPKLLSSANRLVELALFGIPDSGYFSPDVMATALAVMTRLETFHLQFHSRRSRPNPGSRPLPPPTRLVLPALTKLMFGGVYEYLEDLLAQIDAPLLCNLYIEFFMDLNFYIPQLHRLIGHADEFKTFDHAVVFILDRSIRLSLHPKRGKVDHRRLLLRIKCRASDRQLSSLTQICASSFPLVSSLKELKIKDSSSHWKDDMEDTQWLKLLDPFTALKNLYLTDEIAQHVCGALRDLSRERVTEVLPALRNLFVQESSLQPVKEAIKPFVAARKLSGLPMVVDRWKD